MSRVTLSRYLIEQTRSNNTPADLRFLIEVVARACKEISHAVSKGALGGVLGSMGTENVQGEVQKKLDVISNEILLEANEWGGHLAGMASEEMRTKPEFVRITGAGMAESHVHDVQITKEAPNYRVG